MVTLSPSHKTGGEDQRSAASNDFKHHLTTVPISALGLMH